MHGTKFTSFEEAKNEKCLENGINMVISKDEYKRNNLN